jgi:polyisoprenoid-binding protein YceI
MKTFITIIIIVALGFGAWKLLETKPDAGIPQAVVGEQTTTSAETPSATAPETLATSSTVRTIDNANVKVSFTGFGPGKKHDGSFSDVRSNLFRNSEGNLAGEIVVGMNSMSTDNEKVTAHLKKAEFFDTTIYPTATFKLIPTKFVGVDAQGGSITGILTIKNISKEITVPSMTMRSPDGNIVYGSTSKFTINMKEFGIDQKFANETIELNVVVPFKK